MSESKLAEEMDREVVNLLRAYKSPTCLYAAKRIEELEQEALEAGRGRDAAFKVAADCVGAFDAIILMKGKLQEMKQEKHIYPGKAVTPPHTIIDGDSENEIDPSSVFIRVPRTASTNVSINVRDGDAK